MRKEIDKAIFIRFQSWQQHLFAQNTLNNSGGQGPKDNNPLYLYKAKEILDLRINKKQ